jgi:hypothetical protein
MQCNHKMFVPVVPVPTDEPMDGKRMHLKELWFEYWVPQSPSLTDVVNPAHYQHHLGCRSEPDGTVNYLTVFCLPQRKKWRRPDNENMALYHDVLNTLFEATPLEWFGNILVVKHSKDGQLLGLDRDDEETVDFLIKR